MTKESNMGVFDSFSGSVGGVSSTLGSIGTQAMGTLGTIAGTAGRVSGAINSAQGAAQSISALRSISLPPGGNPVARFAQGAALFNGALNQAVGSVGQVVGAVGAIGTALGSVGGLLGGNNPLSSIGNALGAFGGGDLDWRAKLKGAIVGEFVFPYTPTITISGGSNYEEVALTHQNYSFFAYQNSKAESINISGPFFVEDAMQAQEWIKGVNFFRACTKMFQDGNPPIILKFNAYGNYVFKDIPVIVKSYTVDMPQGVDYISTGASHVPIKSTFSVTLQPVYSREKIKTFNLVQFVNGGNVGFV